MRVQMAALLAGTVVVARPARAQSGTHNFQHPPGTLTASLGTLGHVERQGTGPVPVILIAGAPFGWRVWGEFMGRNADRYTMYAVTLPGYGGTAPYPMPTRTRGEGVPDLATHEWSDAIVAAIARLIDAERLVRPVIASVHLVADVIALRVGLEHHDEVRGIITVAGSPGWRVPSEFANRDQWVYTDRVPFLRAVSDSTWRANMAPASRLSVDSAYARMLVREQTTASVPTQIRYFLEFLATDLSTQVARLPVPLLAIEVPVPFDALPEPVRAMFVRRANGDVGAARRAYESSCQWKALGVPDAICETLARSGIFAMHDRPAEFDSAVATFVARLR